MKNLDSVKADFRQKMFDAMQAESPENVSDGMSNAVMAVLQQYGEDLQGAILEQYQEMQGEADTNILAQRGMRQLTGEENTYYQKLSDAMRASNPQQALTDLDVTFPETVIDAIFEDLRANHPLLDVISFTNTSIITKWLLSTSEGVAGWGELCDPITDELGASFRVMEMTMHKLSAFIPVCNAMLDIGPTWLDNYVRQLLAEAIAVALEAAIIDGDGATKPIGMTRLLISGAGGVHAQKTPVPLTSLTPKGISDVLGTLAKRTRHDATGAVIDTKPRTVSGVVMIVNPADYFTKVYPATTPRATDGTFRTDVVPYPMNVIQSVAVPAGKAVIGMPKRYFMGLGRGQNKSGVIEYSDHIRFLDDFRVYRVKLYGNGTPMDDNAFVLCDISGLEPTVLQVEVTNAADFIA